MARGAQDTAWNGLRIGIIVTGIVGLVTSALLWVQLGRERGIDEGDLARRAQVLAHQMSGVVGEALRRPATEVPHAFHGLLDGHRRLIGFALFRADGSQAALGKGVAEFNEELKEPIRRALEQQDEISTFVQARDLPVHILVSPVRDLEGTLLGLLAVIHDTTYLEERSTDRALRALLAVFVLTLLLMTLVVGATWAAYDRPLKNLAEWMRRVRTGEETESPPRGLPVGLLASESDRLAASFRAARVASWAESESVVRGDKIWSRDRLRAHALHSLGGGQLVVASNREPYMHQLREGKPYLIVPAGGLVTALDPVLQACGGLWVAHGSGEADRQTADPAGRLTVPPGDAKYTLRRIWLGPEEEQGYYYGFANEGLWPLCHLTHERPVFRAGDWAHYIEVNRRFASVILEELGRGPGTVLVQDYHLALVPRLLKEERPDLRVGIFWHIPWPNPEAFRICPYRAELLRGMLGADLIGFHLQQFCNNFLETVDRMLEARLDRDHFSVEHGGHRSLVRPFPISIESWEERGTPAGEELEEEIRRLRSQHALGDTEIVVGVERIDYTKGLAERFRAIERFLEKAPEVRGKVTFVVLGAPSRTHLRRYRDLVADLESLADAINWKFQTAGWRPIRFMVGHHDARAVHAFMSMARVCIVSSLHDGMNLVAKEYVAAKEDDDGVLILTEFAGAARELTDALIVNPYDTEQFADAIAQALSMSDEERRARMERMRRIVSENNIYRWAAKLLDALARTHSTTQTHHGSEPAALVT